MGLVEASIDLWQDVFTDGTGVNMGISLDHGVLGDLFGLVKDLLSDALDRWSTVLSVEFDTEIFLWTTWVVTGREHNTTEAVIWTIILIKLSNHGRDSWSGEEAVLTDVNLSDSVGESNLNCDLGGNIVVVSTVTGDNEGFTLVLRFWKSVENGLDEVLKIMFLGEDLDLLSESTSSWLLILIWGLNLDDLLGELGDKFVLINPGFGVLAPVNELFLGKPKIDFVVGRFN